MRFNERLMSLGMSNQILQGIPKNPFFKPVEEMAIFTLHVSLIGVS